MTNAFANVQVMYALAAARQSPPCPFTVLKLFFMDFCLAATRTHPKWVVIQGPDVLSELRAKHGPGSS